jgi:hypothetical protein
MPRSGVIGEQIFQQVEKLVKGGMTRTDAFKQISSESGRREGTVAANYYRVARKRAGGSLRPRRARGRARTATAGVSASRRNRNVAARRAAEPDIDALASSLVQNVQALAAAMTAQAAEVKDLRARLDGVRQLLT